MHIVRDNAACTGLLADCLKMRSGKKWSCVHKVQCISRKNVLGTRTAQAPPPLIIRTPVPTNHDWRLRQDITRKGDTMIMVLDRLVREALAREEEKRKERAQVKDTE